MTSCSADHGRGRRRRRSSECSPSAAVLSFLAVLASATTSQASLPSLSFLCPQLHTKRTVPDKYEQSDDGLWYQAESYSLYGSTLCKSCTDTQQVTPSPTSDTNFDDIVDSLPPGWKPQDHDESRTSLILAMSLVLAFLICFFIIGCMFWRKNVRARKSRNEDIEMMVSLTHPKSNQDVQAKAKLWARASARWRANAKHLARRRRGKRTIPRPPSVIDVPSPSTPDQIPDSTTSSPRSSIEQQRSTPGPVTEQPILPPPAYRQQSTTPSSSSVDTPLTPLPNVSTSASECEAPSIHSAHVATDDKAVLRQLSSLASFPPQQDSESASSALPQLSSSAPEWQYEDEYLPEQESEQSSSTGPSEGSVWPAPPSKGKGVGHYTYDYDAFEFEDDTCGLDAEAQPSAPPFEEHDTGVPSAPPLLLDDPPTRPPSPLPVAPIDPS